MSQVPTPPTPPTLPAPRTPGRYAVAVVCLGNICRSPMADVVLRQRVVEVGLADRVSIASAGTGGWHVGDPMDRRSAAVLSAHDYDPTAHRGRQFEAHWLADHDLILAMDHHNLSDILDVSPDAEPGRVRLFGDYDPLDPGAEVPDPYYGGDQGFEEVLAMVERTCEVLAEALTRQPGLAL